MTATRGMPDPEDLAERVYQRIIASTTKPADVPKIIEDDVNSAPTGIVIEVKRRTKDKLAFAEQTSQKHNDNVKKAIDILTRK
jgi:hypothetical protein